jgi:hypothetical protein
MTKDELTKDELKERRAAVSERRQQLEEELRNFRPPVYFTQREINVEKELMRRSLEACAAYERKIQREILARIVRSWPRLK